MSQKPNGSGGGKAHDVIVLGAGIVGVVGAVTVEWVTRMRAVRRQLAVAALTPEPALNG